MADAVNRFFQGQRALVVVTVWGGMTHPFHRMMLLPHTPSVSLSKCEGTATILQKILVDKAVQLNLWFNAFNLHFGRVFSFKLKDFLPPSFPHPNQKVWRIVGALSAKAGLKLPQPTPTQNRPISDFRLYSNSETRSISYLPRLSQL